MTVSNKKKVFMDAIDFFFLVLSRVQAFLPQIQQANEQLQSKDVSKLNIENVNENEEQYIEMV